MFNEHSALVQIWIRLIKNKTYTLNDVPNLSNLRDIVIEVLNKEEQQ